jgi:hypothetical protein
VYFLNILAIHIFVFTFHKPQSTVYNITDTILTSHNQFGNFYCWEHQVEYIFLNLVGTSVKLSAAALQRSIIPVPIPPPTPAPIPLPNPLLSRQPEPAVRSPHPGRLHQASSQVFRPFPRSDSGPFQTGSPAVPSFPTLP